MSASKSRKARAREDGVTAQPKPIAVEAINHARNESGLSVDSAGLAERFLAEATQQDNYESLENVPPELSLVPEEPGDDALSGPHFEPERTIWEQTVGFTREVSRTATGVDASPADLGNPPVPGVDDEDDDEPEEGEADSSLFDRNADVERFGADRFDDDERWRAAARTGRTL